MDAMGIRKIIKYEFPLEKAFLQGPCFSFREGSSVVHHDTAVSPSLTMLAGFPAPPKSKINVKIELRGSPNFMIPVSRWCFHNPVKRYVTCLH